MGRRLTVFACLALACAAALPGSSVATAGPAVYAYGSLTTVRADQPLPPGGSSAVSLLAARNEFESFQIVVAAGDTGAQGVSVEPGLPLVGPHGAQLSSSALTIYREASYQVVTPSDDEGAAGAWPDALIPSVDRFYGERRNAFPVDLAPHELVTAWIDVLVPRSQVAGGYTGSVVVRDAGGVVSRVPVHLSVLGFTLPSTSTLESAFRISPATICAAHTGSATCSGDAEEAWRLAALYARVGLDDRISVPNPVPLAASQAPTSPADLDRFERRVVPLLDGTAPTRLLGARLTSFEGSTDCVVESTTCLPAWHSLADQHHFAGRFYFYACDEPDQDAAAWDVCKSRAADARSEWPGVPVLVTSAMGDAVANGGTGVPDIISTVVNWMDNTPCCDAGPARFVGNQRPAYDDFLAHDTAGTAPNRLWLYTMCYTWGCGHPEGEKGYWRGWPGYAIDAPASQARALGWLSFEYGATGELYWTTTNMLGTAWTDQYFEHGNGDGTLFYAGLPSIIGGTHDIPIESIRLKRIRDGREDYEYLHVLAAHGEDAFARSVTEKLFGPPDTAMYGANVSQSDLGAARAALGAEIARLLTPPPPPPPPPPQPPPPPPAPPKLRCVVPRVKGKALATARRAIRRRHCSVGRVAKKHSRMRRGRVIGQHPRPGAVRSAGARVNLVVSSGRRRRSTR